MPDSSDNKIITHCPGCDKRYRVKREIVGQRIKCRSCGTSFPVQAKENASSNQDLIEEQQQTIKQQKELLLQYQKELIEAKKQAGMNQSNSIEDSNYNSIEGLESMLLRVDKHGLIQYINSTFCKTFNTSSETLVHQPLDTLKRLIPTPLFLSLDPPEEIGTYDETVKDGAGRVYEIRKTLSKESLDIVLNDITNEQKFKDYVSKYVSTDLLELSDAELQTFRIPERRFMTVSFTDLRGFTAMSETLSPEEVRTTMNSYLEEIIYAINTNQATVDKIVGDEVMALYGAPKYYKDHAFRAIKTACDQIYNLKALQKTFRTIGKTIPDCGIGINSGEMVVGNMGSSTHQDYTVLGAAVNLAARLCGAAMGSQIITTEATMQSAIDNLPEDWGFEIIEHDNGSDSSSIRGKVESIKPLPEHLVGKTYQIGPIPESSDQIKPFFKFDYQFLIQAKGLKDLIPVITVTDMREKAERKDEVLSDEVITTNNDRIFGKYRLIELLGRGGMGEVWKARDPFGNIFAIKILIAGDAASEHQIARFKREAKIMSRLNHRGLCKIIEIGEVDKTTFIAMEYLDGVTLGDLLSIRHTKDLSSKQKKDQLDGFELGKLVTQVKETLSNPDYQVPDKKRFYPIPVDACIELSIKCCQAIEYAHDHGILHRDLKPSNIMIREDGDPVIMDFGLAKISEHHDSEKIEASMSLSVSGEIVGSIEYMSPEQAEASKFVDVRADVYSLGAILYLTLTGKKYFESSGNLLSDISQLEDYEGIRAKDAGKHIPTDIDIISYKSLRPRPEERYQNIKEFRLDLQRYIIGESISAKDITTYEILSKLIYKYKGIAATGIISFILMIIGSLVFVINLNNQKEQAELNLNKAIEAEEKRIKTEKDNAPIWFIAALERCSVGKVGAGLGLIEKALTLSQGNIQYLKVKGEMLLHQQRYSEAHELFLPLIVDYPNDQEIRILERISKKLLIDPGRELEHYQLLKHLTKVGRPYLARVHSSDITFDAFKQAMDNAYPKLDLSRRIKKTVLKGRYFIDFSNLEVNDLSPLKGWKLEGLWLQNTELTNYTILKDLDFTRISIEDPDLESIDFLAGKQLTEVRLDDCPKVTDISPLRGMPLIALVLYRGISDFSLIKEFKLEEFRLIQPLKSNFELSLLKDSPLKYLNLYFNKDLDLSPLEDKSLESLRLNAIGQDSHVVSNIDALESCPNIRLDGVIIEDLNFIDELNTESLFLQSSQIRDYSALNSSSLRRLSILNCNINHVNFLGQENHLDLFSFNHTDSYDMTPLYGKRIHTLILNNTKLFDLSLLDEIQNLEEIHFEPRLIKSPKWVQQFQNRPKLKYIEKQKSTFKTLAQNDFLTKYFKGEYGPIAPILKSNYQNYQNLLKEIKVLNPGLQLADLVRTLSSKDGIYSITIGKKNQTTEITNLGFLKKYPDLKQLIIINCNQIHDFSPISELKQLTELHLDGCKQFKQSGLIRKMPLHTLSIDHLNQFDLSVLKNISSLESLSIEGIADLSQLGSTSIQKIYYESSSVKNGIEQLGKLPALKEVYDTVIPNFNTIDKYWPALIEHYTLIENIKADNPNFFSETMVYQGPDILDLRGRPRISNFNFLQKHPKIKKIYLSNTAKKPDFSPLYSRRWDELAINNEHIQSQDLAKMVSKETNLLNLDDTVISDLSFLNGKFLSSLSLKHTPVQHLKPLTDMSSLKHLNIQDTSIKNLSPLMDLELTELIFTPSQIDTESLRLLRQKSSLQKISSNRQDGFLSARQFWRNYVAGEYGEPDPEFLKDEALLQQFYSDLQADNPDALRGPVVFHPPSSLDISSNKYIKNLNFLRKYPNITDIKLKYMSEDLKDFSPIFDRPALNSLIAEKTNFSNKDLSECARFEGLVSLSITNTNVNNIFPLRNLNIKRLWMSGLKVKDISALKDMTSLELLRINHCLIKNLSSLKGLQLKELGFTPNQYGLEHFRTIVKINTLENFYVDSQTVPKNIFWKNYFEGAYGQAHMELRDEFILGLGLYAEIAKTNPGYKGFQNIQDIEYHVEKGKLISLVLGYNDGINHKLTNLSFLNKYSDLQKLDLSNCKQIKDFSILQNLKNLTWLSLENCSNFNNLDFIKELPIEYLNLNQIPELELDPLTHFRYLNSLEILSHHDFSKLEGVPLKVIKIDTTQENIKNLDVLKNMNSLKAIYDNNYLGISSPSEFWKAFQQKEKMLKAFKEANPDVILSNAFKISHNELITKGSQNIVSMDFLEEFQDLRVLNLEKAGIDDFSFLKHLKNLESLDVKSTSFNNKDLAILSRTKTLKKLNIGLTKIDTLAPLSELNLSQLQISRTKVNDLSPLTQMHDLQTLFMENIVPVNFYFIDHLQNLEALTFTPKILNSPHLRKIYTLRSLKNIGVGYWDVIPASLFWENYFNEQYGEVDQELKFVYDLEKELIFNIQKDNPDFIPDQYFTIHLYNGRIVDLRIGKYRSTHPTNSIKNINFLSNYPELNTLILNHCPNIKNFSPIKNLRMLKTFSIYGNQQFKDLSLLKNLPISKLDLGDTIGLDFSHLKNKKIEYISFFSKGNKHVDTLKDMKSLHTIQDSTLPKTKQVNKYWELFDLYQSIVSDISYYNPQVSLSHLDLELKFDGSIQKLGFNYQTGKGQSLNNTLSNLDFLKTHNQIEELYITANEALTDFSPMRYLQNTYTLSMVNTHFSDLNLISHLPLKNLHINDTGVSDLSPLKGMNLITLSILGQKEISSLEPLKDMMSLKNLVMPYCYKIHDLSPLKDLKLERLVFHPQNIQHGLEFIKNMASIKEISTETQKSMRPKLFWSRIKPVN